MKKLLKGVATLLFLFIAGGLNIVEVVLEIIYQTVRLIRRGYRWLLEGFLKLIKPLYENKKQCREYIDDILYMEYDL